MLALARGCGGAGHASAEPQRVALLLSGALKVEEALILESYRARLLDVRGTWWTCVPGRVVGWLGCGLTPRLRRQVYLCQPVWVVADLSTSLVLDRLAPFTALNVGATTGVERQDACYRQVQAHEPARGAYHWFVKSRPDLVLWEEAPPLASLARDAVHARLLAAVGMQGLTTASFSSGWRLPLADCGADVCLPGACATACAVYDDQLAFVPAQMAAAYFLHSAWRSLSVEQARNASLVETGQPLPPLSEEECAWTHNGFPEGALTRKVLLLGGRWAPLTLEARLFLRKGDVPDRALVGLVKPC